MKMTAGFWMMFGACLAVFAADSFAKAVKVPSGGPIMTDGICEETEWKGSAKIAADNVYSVRAAKSTEYLNLCIERSDESMFWADVFASTGGTELFTLHASAKLGERKLDGAKWKDWTSDWPWWTISGWWANTLRPTNQGYLPHRAIEFQISRRRFAGRSIRMMLAIEGTKHVLPLKANDLDPKTWLDLKL